MLAGRKVEPAVVVRLLVKRVEGVLLAVVSSVEYMVTLSAFELREFVALPGAVLPVLAVDSDLGFWFNSKKTRNFKNY